MKVDVIGTRFGDIEVEYSTFTKGFFIKKFPEKLEKIAGLKLLTSRDNSYKEFEKLQSHVKDLVHNAMIDFEFEKKVILYRIHIDSFDDRLSFHYLVCDVSVKSQTYQGVPNNLREYFVLDSNIEKYIGKRNILGQILFSETNDYVRIDYDEKIHTFFKEFTSNFHLLKSSLVSFFDKDKVVFNILNSQTDLKLLGR
jgi:hypothetical protein